MPLSAYRTDPEMYYWQEADDDTHSEIEGNNPRPYGHAHFESFNLLMQDPMHEWWGSAKTKRQMEDHFTWIIETLKKTRADLENPPSAVGSRPDEFRAISASGDFHELKAQILSLGASSFLAGGCVAATIFAVVLDVTSPYLFLSLAFPLAGVAMANIIRALGRSD